MKGLPGDLEKLGEELDSIFTRGIGFDIHQILWSQISQTINVLREAYNESTST